MSYEKNYSKVLGFFIYFFFTNFENFPSHERSIFLTSSASMYRLFWVLFCRLTLSILNWVVFLCLDCIMKTGSDFNIIFILNFYINLCIKVLAFKRSKYIHPTHTLRSHRKIDLKMLRKDRYQRVQK